jgi:ribosomally synthesized peptide (two-chain TOMM family)
MTKLDVGPSNEYFYGYGTYDRFLAFRAAVMSAVALVWRQPELKKEFKEHPRAAFKKHLNYNFPFDLDLGVDLDNATWDPEKVADWFVTTTNVLSMVLPPAPQNPAEHVQALAAYNATHLTFASNRKAPAQS